MHPLPHSTMATLQTIAHELKKRNAAVKLARSVSDFACRIGADKETQDFLWERYQSLQKTKAELEFILEQVGSITIDLERATEWRSTGVYAPRVLELLRRSYPASSDRVFQLRHQEMIDKASEQQNLAMAELTRLLKKASPYLSS